MYTYDWDDITRLVSAFLAAISCLFSYEFFLIYYITFNISFHVYLLFLRVECESFFASAFLEIPFLLPTYFHFVRCFFVFGDGV